MDLDELDPRQKKAKPRDLSGYSVDELNDYIAMLEAEIVRVREDIARKQSHMNAAAAFFKK